MGIACLLVMTGADLEPVGGGGLLIFDRVDVEVHGPNSNKGILDRNVFLIYRCSQGASTILILNLHKKPVCVRRNEYS